MPEQTAAIIERLGSETIDECLALAVDRAWAPEAHKWQLLFDNGEVWGIRNANGDLVGTATATRFGGFVAIGNVLVARSAERQGLGGTLMRHIVQRHDDAVIVLNATPFGLPLYTKLGFVTVGTTHTHRGIFVPDAASTALVSRTRPATIEDLPALARFDAEIVGAEREPLLRSVLDTFADNAFVIEGDGGDGTGHALEAFGASWSNVDHVQVGPLLGSSDEHIKALITALAQSVDGAFRVDLNDRDVAVREWATAHGLIDTNSSTLMVYRADPFPGDRSRWYSAIMQAIG